MNTFNNKPGGGNRARPLAKKSHPAGTPAVPFHPPVKPIRTDTDKPVRSKSSGVSQASGTPKNAHKLNTHKTNAPHPRTASGNSGPISKGRPEGHPKQIKQQSTPVSGGRSSRGNQNQISQAHAKAYAGPGIGLPLRQNGMPGPKQMNKQQSKPSANVQGRRMEPSSPAPRITRAPSLPPTHPVWPPKPPAGMAGKKPVSEGQAVPPA